jgi:hypothetical protein
LEITDQTQTIHAHPMHLNAVRPLENVPALRTATSENDIQTRLQEISATPVMKPTPTFEFGVDIIDTVRRIMGLDPDGFITMDIGASISVPYTINQTYIRGLINVHLETNRQTICPICYGIQVIFLNMEQIQSTENSGVTSRRLFADFTEQELTPTTFPNDIWNGSVTFGFKFPAGQDVSVFPDFMLEILLDKAGIITRYVKQRFPNGTNTKSSILIYNIPNITAYDKWSGTGRISPCSICIVVLFIVLVQVNTSYYW